MICFLLYAELVSRLKVLLQSKQRKVDTADNESMSALETVV